MDENDIKRNLKDNMVKYFNNKKRIEEMEKEQDNLKEQNLQMVKLLGLKIGESLEFRDILLKVQYMQMTKTKGVDEDGLNNAYGIEKINSIKTLDVKLLRANIKAGKLPSGAEDFVLKDEPIQFTKILSI